MGSCCRLVVRPDINIMLRAGLVLLAVLCLALAEPQNNNRFRNNRNNRNNGNRPARQNRNRPNSNQFSRNGVTRNGARDAKGTEVYPGCSGKVCLPDAKLCAARKQQKGADSFRGKTYWYSWESNEAVLKNARWNWFTARNYCRKRCMDLISIESEEEQEFLGRAMNGGNVRRCGLAAGCATRRLTAATSHGSNLTTSGAGSGPQPCRAWGKLMYSMEEGSTGGPTLALYRKHSLMGF